MSKHMWVPLDAIAPIKQGMVSSKSRVWYLNLEVVEPNSGRILKYSYKDSRSISPSTIAFDTGNVLYSKLRPYLNKVVVPSKDGYATSELLPLRPDSSQITREYLACFLRSNSFVKFITEKVAGAKMPRVVINELKSARVPLPSIEEQNRITDQLNTVSELIRLRKQQLEELEQLVKSQYIKIFGDPVVISNGGRIAALCTLTNKIGSGATPRGGNAVYATQGISLIRSMNVYNGYFDYDGLAHIDLDQAKQLANVSVEEEDILLNITGASVARCCIVPDRILPARVNQHVCIIRCKKDKILPLFLNQLLIGNHIQQKLRSMAEAGGATRQALTKQQIENLEVILPQFELQKQFTNFVESIESTKSHIKRSLLELETINHSLTHQYFENNLYE